jgi:hypothetical protein
MQRNLLQRQLKKERFKLFSNDSCLISLQNLLLSLNEA